MNNLRHISSSRAHKDFYSNYVSVTTQAFELPYERTIKLLRSLHNCIVLEQYISVVGLGFMMQPLFRDRYSVSYALVGTSKGAISE